MSLQNAIRNGMLTASGINPVSSNSPVKNKNMSNKWSDETALLYEQIGPYASDVYNAQIQGLDYGDFYSWSKVKIRVAKVFDPTTGENLDDSWRRILVIGRNIDFIPQGAFVKFNKSVWIVYNPTNLASPVGTAVIVRCNCTYNSLDYYGNLVKTPMMFAKGKILASGPYYQEYSAMIDGYAHIITQKNSITSGLNNNSRVLLGKSAFALFGYVDFDEEFTGDETTAHVIKADLRLTEAVPTDNFEKHVASDEPFSWEIKISGESTVGVGESQTLVPTSIRNGTLVTSSEENPINYTWKSQNISIATVDMFGKVTGVAEGTTTIVCELDQNPDIEVSFTIEVTQAQQEPQIALNPSLPNELEQFSSVTTGIGLRSNGEALEAEIYVSGSGSNSSSYSITNNQDGTFTIACFAPDEMPLSLEITAVANGHEYQKTVTISLVGY